MLKKYIINLPTLSLQNMVNQLFTGRSLSTFVHQKYVMFSLSLSFYVLYFCVDISIPTMWKKMHLHASPLHSTCKCNLHNDIFLCLRV